MKSNNGFRYQYNKLLKRLYIIHRQTYDCPNLQLSMECYFINSFYIIYSKYKKPKEIFSFLCDVTFMTNLWFDMCKIDRLYNINDNFKLIDSFWSCLASQSQEWSAQSQKKYGHRLSEWSLSFNRFANYWRDSFFRIKCNRLEKKEKMVRDGNIESHLPLHKFLLLPTL